MTLLTSDMNKKEVKSFRSRGPQIMKTAIEIAPRDQKLIKSRIKVHDERVQAPDDIPVGTGYITQGRLESYFDQS